MYLKSLELMGFKSFGRKTVFDFEPGITAIIGPNGSGKSNVCDAIRWVLGEQSAKVLRGNKMSEVIFAGSNDFRASAFAQVKLILDNQDRSIPIDYSDVSLSRQLFRSGESNYIINNSRTLLSSIKEMLMDTGIGKDGYSVIGQGDIDDIVFQKTQSRRVLIEEAAGITRFRHRKNSALNKLGQTRANITRLQDIISEIDSQLGPLQEQAEKTRRYQTLASEIRQLQIDLVLFELNELYHQQENIESMRSGLLLKLEELSKFLAEVDSKKADARTGFLNFEKSLEEKQQEIKKYQTETDELKQVAANHREQIKSYQSRSSTISEEIEGLEHSIEDSNCEISEAGDRLAENEALEISIKSEVSDIEQKHSAVKQELEAHLRGQADDKNSAFEVAVKLADAKNRINTTNQQIQMLERQLDKGESDVKSSKERIDKLLFEKERLTQEISQINSEISENRSLHSTDSLNLVKLKKELAQKEEQFVTVSDQIKISQARLNLLDEIRHSRESGIFRGVQAALALKDSGRLSGIFGMVSDLITVPDGYETAFETALGGSIQDLVTADAETAKNAISILKQNKAGRATFLPLDMIKPSSSAVAPSFKGSLGTAMDLIEYDAKFYNVMSYLLGRVLMFDNIQNAVEFARTNRNYSRIVTLEGEIIRSSGALTGGADTKKTGGILARKREQQELQNKTNRLLQHEKQLKSIVGDLKKKTDNIAESLRKREEILTRREQSLEFFTKSLQKNETELQSCQQSFNQVNADRTEMQEKLCQLRKESNNALEQLKELEQHNAELSARLNSMSDKEQAMQNSRLALDAMLSDKKLELAQVAERKKAISKEIEAAKKRQKATKERKARASDEISRLDNLIKASETKLLEVQQKIDKTQRTSENLDDEIERMQKEYRERSREVEKLDQAFQSRIRMEDSTRSKLSELDIKLAEITTNINNKSSYLSNEFGIDLNEISINLHKYESCEDLINRITKRKYEQEALEPVNPLAIEDFEKTKERYDFLDSQMLDLTEAAQSLEQVIAEIEKISSERFEETFSNINKAFNDIFEILFPGGQGILKLTDPQTPLESDINIVCRLPGKKLSTLELFSGGEKALISLALLFSILQVKPPAFCLLDEVEAALDEANVRRFTRMLRSFADKTQFILITHNKETMQAVDVIYGVTLQKNGISRPVSIRLEDDEKITQFTVGGSKKRGTVRSNIDTGAETTTKESANEQSC